MISSSLLERVKVLLANLLLLNLWRRKVLKLSIWLTLLMNMWS